MAERTWKDRIREGAYTDALGHRIVFQFEDVSRTTPLRTSVFSFAGVDNDYVQQNGFGSRVYPLRCYFSGGQCDLMAQAFEAILLQPGLGKLEHPLYGPIPNVVPVGDITRNDALKTAANQSVVEVTFWTSTGAVYPSSAASAADDIFDAIANFDYWSARGFNDRTTLTNPVHKSSLTAGIRKMLGGVSKALSSVSAGVTSINKEFRDIQSTVNYGMDVLIGQPLLLAQQIQNLIKAPARALTGIQTRLDGYWQLQQSIFGSAEGNPLRELTGSAQSSLTKGQIANNFHAADLMAMSSIVGSVLTVSSEPVSNSGNAGTLGAGFTTKPEAITAAATLADQFNELLVWRDEGFGALADLDGVANYQIDSGEAYEALRRTVALALGNLIEISFSLLPERAIILDRPRTIIDLCAEIYPNNSIDDKLDFIIDTNNLSGDEILVLPRFRKIVYYAA